MPAGVLIRASLERVLNRALRADPRAPARLQQVQGKTFRLAIKGLPEPVTVAFYGTGVMLPGPEYEAIDCELTVGLRDLPRLQDAGYVTKALQSGQLQLTGDAAFAQQAAAVFTGLEIDWEDQLARYVGDVPAFWGSQLLARCQQAWQQAEPPRQTVSEWLTDESQLAVSPVHWALLDDELVELQQRLEQLEQAVCQWESKT